MKWHKNIFFGACAWMFLCGLSSAADNKTQEMQIVTVDQIERQAEEYLSDNLQGNADDREIKVKYDGRDLELPKGKYRFVYSVPAGAVRTGRLPFSIRIEFDDNKHRMLHLNAMVNAYQDIVKIRRAIRRGEVLTPDDVSVDRVKTSQPVFDAISRAEDAIGFEVSQNIESGKILTFGILKKPYVIKRGDHILLVMDKGPMKITVPGIAREQGYKGSTIPVENSQSKKVVYGEILDEKTIRVNF